jgi:hypothetical protein
MKNHPIYGYFQVEVNAWWEWFLTTIIEVGPTGFIAVANRSHNILKPFPGMKKFSSLIQLDAPRPAAPLTRRD